MCVSFCLRKANSIIIFLFHILFLANVRSDTSSELIRLFKFTFHIRPSICRMESFVITRNYRHHPHYFPTRLNFIGFRSVRWSLSGQNSYHFVVVVVLTFFSPIFHRIQKRWEPKHVTPSNTSVPFNYSISFAFETNATEWTNKIDRNWISKWTKIKEMCCPGYCRIGQSKRYAVPSSTFRCFFSVCSVVMQKHIVDEFVNIFFELHAIEIECKQFNFLIHILFIKIHACKQTFHSHD